MMKAELTTRLLGLGFEEAFDYGLPVLVKGRKDGCTVYVFPVKDRDMTNLEVRDQEQGIVFRQCDVQPIVAFYAVVGILHCV